MKKLFNKPIAFYFKIAIIFFLAHLLLSYIATKNIAYLGIFSYPELLDRIPYPDFLKRLASFDGLHYLKISKEGYERNSPAFFPLYPVLISTTSLITGLNHLISTLLISTISFAFYLFFLDKLLVRIGVTKKEKNWVFIFILLFPTSFFFIASYTESLFMMLLTMSLYFVATNKKVPLLITGFLTPLTRFVGLFLIVSIFWHSLKMKLSQTPKNIRHFLLQIIKSAFSINVLVVVSGFLTYAVFLYIFKNDPLAFFNSQKDFGMGRQTDLILFPQVIYRYLKILFTADLSFQYLIALIELVAFLFVGFVLFLEAKKLFKAKDYLSLRTSILIFSIINLLLPTFTGTFASIPRYALASISVFVYLSQITNKSIKFFIATVFAILHIFMFMYFIQGYFVS